MKTTTLKISEIKPNPDNPRVIKDDAFKKLVQSIKEFPEMIEAREIVVNTDMVILGGNMRFRALKEAGVTDVPVKIVDWSEDKQREFVIKDNVSGGEWDYDMLANQYELEELSAWGLDLPGVTELGADIEEDVAPEISQDPPVSKLGEIYQLGRHRVMCGDSTDKASVELLMNGAKADMVFTDPPYGNGNAAHYGRGELGHRHIAGDEDFSVTEKSLTILKDYPQLFFLQWRTIVEAMTYLISVGKGTKTVAVWDKKNSALGQGMAEQWEAIIISGDVKYAKFGGNVFRVSREQKRREDSPHPHQKPIELLVELFNFFEAKTFIDPFLGSGSTLIACEQTDRTCYGMELDPKYVDVIRKRYWKFINNGDETGWENGTPVI